MSNTVYALKTFQLLKSVHDTAIDDNSPLKDAPAEALRVPLRVHQQAVLGAMESLERQTMEGIDCSGDIVYSSYGILGDSVGVGKSLMVLGHIASLRDGDPIKYKYCMGRHSSKSLFSVKKQVFTDCSEAGSIIIVPHTLFTQWADYIRRQTNLKAVFIERRKQFDGDTLLQSIMAAEIVLISNTLYKEMSRFIMTNQIIWKRAFYDEADTVHIVNGYELPVARFTWFITASWSNILFSNDTLYVSSAALNEYIFNPGAPYRCLTSYFADTLQTGRNYAYIRFMMTSFNAFRHLLNVDHKLRSKVILRCSSELINKSISLPPLTRRNILCRAPLRQNIVADIVPSNVLETLHGGDVAGAIEALGVKTEGVTNLVQAVTLNLQKELERLKATYAFKAELEYSTPHVKETALKSLADKIRQKEDAIKIIRERIEGFKGEMCPICYDEPEAGALFTPCCSRIFCAGCILTCLANSTSCPMCRHTLGPKQLTKVITQEEKNMIVKTGAGAGTAVATQPTENKVETMLRIIKENPEGRFLVFSRYDNPFTQMESYIETMNESIKVRQLKGNKDAIAATLRAFHDGKLRCLLLNSQHAGAGLNITGATHVILMHAMTHEEEKQILGRAYRMGRTGPLTFYRLLHSDELPVSNAEAATSTDA